MVDSEECDEQLRQIRENIHEIGPFRLEGSVKALCPVCLMWCDAEITPSLMPGSGVSLSALDDSGVLQIHVDVTLHAHVHECPRGREAVHAAAENHRPGSWFG